MDPVKHVYTNILQLSILFIESSLYLVLLFHNHARLESLLTQNYVLHSVCRQYPTTEFHMQGKS